VLGKSVKPIPVMILGVVLARKRYTWRKYLFVLMITFGVALFLYKPSENKGKAHVDDPVFGWGEVLLVSVRAFMWLNVVWIRNAVKFLG
jgi:solute carrier family 35 (UDP-galactose transporter), member B1